jgi:hypothetical protein
MMTICSFTKRRQPLAASQWRFCHVKSRPILRRITADRAMGAGQGSEPQMNTDKHGSDQ